MSTNLAPSINELILAVEQEAARQEAQAKEFYKQSFQQAKTAVEQALKELGMLEILLPYIEQAADYKSGTLTLNVNPERSEPPLELAPFQIRAHKQTQMVTRPESLAYSVRLRIGDNYREEYDITDKMQAGKFFKERRDKFLEIQQVKKEAEYQELKTSLEDYYRRIPYTEPDRAHFVHVRMVTLAPEHAEKSHAAYQWWLKYRAEQIEAVELQKQREAVEDKAAAEYEAAFYSYWREQEAINARNVAALDKLQAELDQPFTVYKLTYAYVAKEVADEGYEGETYADTKSVYVTASKPDEQRYWTVISKTGKERKKFKHLVSISDAIRTKPTDNLVSQSTYVGERRIFFLSDTLEYVKARIAAILEASPQAPDVPDVLPRDRMRTIQARIMDTEGEEEPQF